jgi:predicted PurR-regulated permease PerM
MADATGRRLGATLVSLFVAALLLIFLSRVAQILLLLFIAVLISAFFSAFTDVVVARTRVRRPIALALAVVVTTGAVFGMGWLILPPVIIQTQDLLSNLPLHVERLESLLLRLAQKYPLLEGALGPEGGGLVESLLADASRFVRESLLPYLTAGGALAVETVSVAAMALYFARDPGLYRDGLVALVPPRARHLARTVYSDLGETIRAWIWAQLLAMLVLGTLTVIGLWLLDVPYALAFGVFAGAAAIVPFFGTVVSTALPALFVLSLGGWSYALAVAALGVAVHLIEANVVVPLIFERRISVPPALTILSVLIMATVLGVLGLLVAVPLLASILVVARHVLLTHVYGDHDPRVFESAVLVTTTGTRRAVAMAPR